MGATLVTAGGLPGRNEERVKLPPFEHVKPIQCAICNGLKPTPEALAALETLRICDVHWRRMQTALNAQSR